MSTHIAQPNSSKSRQMFSKSLVHVLRLYIIFFIINNIMISVK